MTSFLEAPPIRPTDIELRDYQIDAITAVRDEFAARRRSTLLILPTGCGKTVTFGMIARRVAERGGRALVLAHREELIDQAAETLTRLGLDVGVEKAGSHARALYDPHAVVASVQTLRPGRLALWPADYFRLVIVDEAHHAVAESYRKILRHFDAFKLGVTATADRADGESLGQVYESVAYEYSLWDAMTAPPPGPYLCRYKFVQCDVGIDLRDIRTTGDDLNAADLEDAIRPHVETLANAIRQEIGDRKTIVFTPDVGSAQAMATALESIGVKAAWVAGSSADRRDIIRAFKRGEFQVLCNCMIATEGFDVPDISAVVLCRPTQSRALYSQMCGRGCRLAPGKRDCLLVDFDWLTTRHELVKPVELFDSTTTDDETLAIAAELTRGAKGVDVMEAVEQARVETARRTTLRIKAREREILYRKVSYDPLAAMESLGMVTRKEADKNLGTATEKQKAYLAKLGVAATESLSKRHATRLIDEISARRQQGLASFKQVSWLISKGFDPVIARSMTKEQASEALGRTFQRV